MYFAMLEMMGSAEVPHHLKGEADGTTPSEPHETSTVLAFKSYEELKAVRGLMYHMVKRLLALVDGTCRSCAAFCYYKVITQHWHP
jgi:hypothetical protein